MKLLVACICLVGVVALAQQEVPIIRLEQDVRSDGYSYNYELGNGIAAQESGSLKDPETIAVQGSYRHTGPDGQVYDTQYISDENGYQPSGAHLPVSPDVPEAIQRSLAYLATLPPNVEGK